MEICFQVSFFFGAFTILLSSAERQIGGYHVDDFTKILPGELIWKPEHCEIYIRNVLFLIRFILQAFLLLVKRYFQKIFHFKSPYKFQSRKRIQFTMENDHSAKRTAICAFVESALVFLENEHRYNNTDDHKCRCADTSP